MDNDRIDCAFADADRQFARAARGNKDWLQSNDTKATLPWWLVAVECAWTLIQADTEFWSSLRPNNYRQSAVAVLTELGRRIFDRFLVPYQTRTFGQVGAAEPFREDFANYLVCELLPRVTERVLSDSTAVNPASSALHTSESSAEDAAQEPREDAQGPDRSLESIEKRKAERRALRDAYKAESKAAGVNLTDKMIAEKANPKWKDGRTAMQKWLACDPRYDGRPDQLIRKVLTEKPHLPRKR